MNKYSLINPPLNIFNNSRKGDRKEATELLTWFTKNKKNRIELLTTLIRSQKGYESWEPDYSSIAR